MTTAAIANGIPDSCKLVFAGAGTGYLDFDDRPVDSIRVQASAAGDLLVFPSSIPNPTVPAIPTAASSPIPRTAMKSGETRYLEALAPPQVFAFTDRARYVHFRVPGAVTLTVNGLVMGA